MERSGDANVGNKDLGENEIGEQVENQMWFFRR
jgi:hypothetical protein